MPTDLGTKTEQTKTGFLNCFKVLSNIAKPAVTMQLQKGNRETPTADQWICGETSWIVNNDRTLRHKTSTAINTY